MTTRRTTPVLATTLLLAAILPFSAAHAADASPGSGSPAVDDTLLSNDADGTHWAAFGRTYSEQRFSPLRQVSTDSITDLRPAWYLDLPGDRGLVSTPLVVDGVLYFVGSMNRVRAVNATTGELLWTYDPEVAKYTGNDLRSGWEHNRGIGLWNDKVYVATWDGRLNAVNRATGEEVWSVRTFPADSALYITGAPKVFKGKVLIGNGGTEEGPTRGYVTAYDAETGEQAWRFFIVPGNPADGFENEAMKMAAETWTGDWWRHGGGGNAWHGFTYDAELDQLYIGTGNGSPWNRKIRSPGGGDNLFLCSVVALDPDTGDYLWHYQTTPGETWDYNSNMDIVLADLDLGDGPEKVLLHAPKNGFLYVIRRSDGKLLGAHKFAETTWASHIDLETGRPVEIPGARYEDGGPVRIAPSPWGAHSWHAMSFNPGTGLLYLPSLHLSMEYTDEGIDLATWQSVAFEGGLGVNLDNMERAEDASVLQAWDPAKGELAWSRPLEGRNNAGTLTTAGNLVFQGRASGEFVAYDATTGATLWTWDAGLGISAPPVTYAVDGKQYVAVLVGFGGGMSGIASDDERAHGWSYGAQTRRLVAFSLDGSAQVPKQPPPLIVTPVELPYFEIDEGLAERGADTYGYCSACHGGGARSGGMAPDLRASAVVGSAEAFAGVVRDGERKVRGMPAFRNFSDDQLLELRHYIRREADAALRETTK